jgi:hypothetical protein
MISNDIDGCKNEEEGKRRGKEEMSLKRRVFYSLNNWVSIRILTWLDRKALGLYTS